MNKELWKTLTNTQKILYLCHIGFSYGGTLGVSLWSFLIEKLVSSEVSAMAKVGCVGILCIALMILFAIIFTNRHFNKVLDTNQKMQDTIVKDMVMETNAQKKEEMRKKLVSLENANVKIKANLTIFKNAILCAIFLGLTILCYMMEKSAIEMRGVFMGITSCLLVGFGFNTAYEEISKKINLK